MLRNQVESRPVLIEPFPVIKGESRAQSDHRTPGRANAAGASSTKDPSESVGHDSMTGIEANISSLAIQAPAQPCHWLVCTTLDAFDDTEYIRQRNGLSNAAWGGDWDAALNAIEKGASNFGEEWANAPRLSE